jgi:superfamily I DNA and/or RNA helicase
LDQFLEHLIAVGIEKIIRIGGYSSSRILEGKNLRLVSQTEGKTGSERHLVGSSHANLEKQERIVKSKLRILNCLEKTSWESLNDHLCRRYPHIYSEFSRIDSEGFARVGKVEPFDLWTTGKGENLEKLNEPLRSLNGILWRGNRNIYELALADRIALLDHWVQEVHGNIIAETFDEIQKDDRLRQLIADVHDEVDRRVLETADVIGVTTSGLAKRISVLRHIDAKVVFWEEAGEVLEAHMLSAVIPSVQHLIQIGDHQQLRPQINNYNLSLESQQGGLYQLDRSQFERL